MHRFFQKYVDPNATVVDIASGYGEFLNNICAKNKIAIDLNPDVKKFFGAEVDFHLRPATELGSVIDNAADIVFTSNFLEHLPD